jgi:alkylation response protein AidB-like acyl-CoA dehydrogenase
MQIYKAPLQDIRFNLEVLGYDEIAGFSKYEDFDIDTAMAIIEEAGRFCTNELLPLNRVGDEQGVQWDPETREVKTPDGFKELYKRFVESGLLGLISPVEYGGTGAPTLVGIAMGEFVTATNKSFSMCPGLTNGLIEALEHCGTEHQKNHYLTKLVSGEWSGTMCLTEPQCGTDLGLMKTTAVPDGDGYILNGTKIWITFGEHDWTDNIIHMVLARLPGAPEGIRGISAFIVPKINEDGSKNGIYCAGLEHKLGIHASPTCVMNLEDAKGYLVGEAHRGMRAMFVMMNAARLTVGLEGVAFSEIAYQTALEFAKDRRQMRSLDPAKQELDQPADTILVHPDVRRQLLNIKSTTEGMRALCLYVAKQIDLSKNHADEAIRQESDDLVTLLTPIIKSYCTERGFQNVSDAMQVCGGAGYTKDWSIEQFMRDERIAMIYEGTNHIQALDLVGRKLPIEGGRLARTFGAQITKLIHASKEDPRMAEFLEPLKKASKTLTAVTMQLGMKGMEDHEEAGAAASNYLNIFALTSLAYVWALQAHAALDGDSRFHRAKIKTARYFMHHILPEMDSLVAIMDAGKQHMMAFDTEDF